MRRLLLALCVTALVLAGAGSAGANISKAAIRQYLLHDPGVSAPIKETIRTGGGGAGIDRLVYGDLTGDGKPDVAVTVFSGGTAGDIAYYVLTTQGGTLHAIQHSNQEYKVGVQIYKGRLEVTRPLYASSDPNCCPSHLEVTDYRYNGRTMAVVSRKRFKTTS
jgi:hypothetical protein